MAELGPPPPPPPAGLPPPPPPPPPAPRPRGRRAWARRPGALPLSLGALGLAAIASWRLLGDDDHPDEWDPRVAELAAFVEDERELRFEHPVHVDFLTADEYGQTVRSDEAGLTDEDREGFEHAAALYRALGLAEGELDLFEAFNDVQDAGTLAFYDPVTERIRVRGTEVTPGMRVTLVHELTHVLQDQHFDLDALDGADAGAATAFRALAEGDALHVEEAYTADELSPDDLTEFEDEHASGLATSEDDLDDVPAALTASFAAPYDLGAPLVLALLNDGGLGRLDEAYDDPPSTEEHLFDPLTYLIPSVDQAPADVDIDVDDPLDEDVFGALGWYLMLVERIDPVRALAAVDGWDGDRYALFEDDGRVCVRAAFAGDRREDEAEMEAALEAWVDAMPAGDPEVEEIDGRPGLRSCDPGPDAAMALTDRTEHALALPSLRSFLIADALSVVDGDEARCYADDVLATLTFEEITDPEGAVFESDRFGAAVEAAIARCTG